MILDELPWLKLSEDGATDWVTMKWSTIYRHNLTPGGVKYTILDFGETSVISREWHLVEPLVAQAVLFELAECERNPCGE